MTKSSNHNFMLYRPLILICLLSFLYSCGDEVRCQTRFVKDFGNSIDADINIGFRSINVYRGESAINHQLNLSALESTRVELQSISVSYNSDSCIDNFFDRRVEISNDSLSMYTFCKSPYKKIESIRILDISSMCLIDETQILTAY